MDFHDSILLELKLQSRLFRAHYGQELNNGSGWIMKQGMINMVKRKVSPVNEGVLKRVLKGKIDFCVVYMPKTLIAISFQNRKRSKSLFQKQTILNGNSIFKSHQEILHLFFPNFGRMFTNPFGIISFYSDLSEVEMMSIQITYHYYYVVNSCL